MIYPDDFINKVIQGDCIEVMQHIPDKSIDLVLTDPPYPDYHAEIYQYKTGILDILKSFTCKQFVFWSAKVDFPLDYTAIHIWNKKTGVGSMYERIFERNGGNAYRVYDFYLINSTVAASYAKDIYAGHPSQKNIHLIGKLIEESTKEGDLILDPFLGSGTTAVACKRLNRRFIGIEISEKYCQIARDRLANEPEPLFKDSEFTLKGG
jgi:site-specific DNA-methyltransferase (adenine-specific)